jgi:adenylate cyclase
MSVLGRQAISYQRKMAPLMAAAVVGGLLLLPVAMWLDLRGLSERMLRLQASDTGRVIDDMRAFYASDVVGRIMQNGGAVTATHDYKSTPGGIPIPATLSIELGKHVSGQDGAVRYRFVSDLPFKGREHHDLDAFERDALQSLRQHPGDSVVEASGSIFDRQVRIATPVTMGPVCVACHNTHPDSPKTDWRVGDVRGIQEITVHQPLVENIFAFKYLLAYLVLAAATGFTFIGLQWRQANLIEAMNRDLAAANGFLTTISAKLSKYLPTQVYESIFSGQTDAKVATRRKKLTIFFSDIKDFTATTERLQPEDLTALLNEYLTEMAAIAHRHGGTVDKFIGDAMLVFFGDPETSGTGADAKAALAMAMEMQGRLEQLNREWRHRGIEQPFRARMGINTGYCNVGNFGSEDRLDYTIVGAEANLAARLQASAEPGQIVLSFETYALVRDRIRARALEPIQVKGVSRPIIPYVVEGPVSDATSGAEALRERVAGLSPQSDPEALDGDALEQVKRHLKDVLAALDAKGNPAALGGRKASSTAHPVTTHRVPPDRAAVERATRWRVPAFAMALLLVGGSAGAALYLWQRGQAGAVRSRPAAPLAHLEIPPTTPPPVPATLTQTAESSAATPAAPSAPTQTVSQSAPSSPVEPVPAPPTRTPPKPEGLAMAVPLAHAPPPGVREPEMVPIPGGQFQQGSREDPTEEPVQTVTIRPFWMGKYPVTVGEWRSCAAAHACPEVAGGDADEPVRNVSWLDAMEYVTWLARVTGRLYRLPSEAEWEYAARAGTASRYWWGAAIGSGHASCNGCGTPRGLRQPPKVGRFPPNPFGLFDMAGGVAEWVADCWHPNYVGAPNDGTAWECRGRGDHVLRGGSWTSDPGALRVSDREHYEPDVRYPGNGFRVAL